jgi:hypothetical protein
VPRLRDRLDVAFVAYALAVGVVCAGLYYWVLVGLKTKRAPEHTPAVDASLP